VQVAPVAERLRTVVEPLVENAGFDLDDLVVSPAGKRRLVRVVLDADEGVTLDQCADVSREVSRALDDLDVMGSQPYTLEVSSRGVSRPLTLPRHWRRALGRLVAATTRDGRTVRGRVTGSDDSSVVLDVDGSSHTLRYDAVAKAVVQVEMSRRAESEEA
jgi:ribosome maturation factor RimP